MLGDLGGAFSVPTVRIGLRLGLFNALHEDGPATADKLAKRIRVGFSVDCRRRDLTRQCASSSYRRSCPAKTLRPKRQQPLTLRSSHREGGA